ncbi:two-component sensor histidine kinase [Streptomyces actuosus]|uniref:histidine kinase n=1 Tax=Streptomyces actuosus TaxID=1885 RepID=A0A2U9NUV0_STRAS|nr:two-component sensor histidine kinase [Streptomyces actuosus]MBM4826504.1 two-component sensor histidine kinase [Streptomyces actuosus]
MGRGDRVLRRTAYGIAVLGAAGCVATVPVHDWLAERITVAPLYWSDLVLGTVWPLVGAVAARGRPRNPVCWLMLLPAMIGPYHLLAYYAGYSRLVAAKPLPGWEVGAWVGCWGFVGYWFATPLVPLLFPYGRLETVPRRVCARIVVTVAGIGTLATMLRPSGTDPVPGVPNPLGTAGWEWLHVVMLVCAVATMLGGTLVAAVFLVLRTRAATGAERVQLQWLMLGGLLMAFSFLSLLLDDVQQPALVGDLVMLIGLLGPPASVAVAMLRHGLFDVELVLGRAIVFTVLSALVLGVYAGVVAGARLIAPGSLTGTCLLAFTALIAANGRGAVQAAVDRTLFGHRHDPYAVVAHVGRRVAPAGEPAEAMQHLVDALRSALRLPYAAFESPAVAAASGTPAAGAGWRSFPCRALGRELGVLRVGRRSVNDPWTAKEQAAVEEVADRAGTLAYAAGLVEDIARSRSRILSVREEERRRLRADLHDGIGPSLAGTAHQLDALARRIDDPCLADCARTLRDRLRSTVVDLRTVVQGLRPAVLDQLGLRGALRELLAGYDTPACHSSIDGACHGLPAAVEVAAYAIAAEAVANAVRHSAAGRLELTAHVEDTVLILSIRDNGRGIPPRHRPGVGLRSMGERAAEVGGRLEVTTAPGEGTLVRATLPVGDQR